MTLPSKIITDILHLASLSKKEICGIVSTTLEIIPINNVSTKPETSFTFDKRQYFKTLSQLNNQDQGVLCLYHSHPTASPNPSKEDLEYLQRSPFDMLIVSPKGYRYIDAQKP